MLALPSEAARRRVLDVVEAARVDLGLAQEEPLNLNEGPHFEALEAKFLEAFGAEPLFGPEALEGLRQDACVVLRFGEIFPEETALPTPAQRPTGLLDPPQCMGFDYLSLAVACQLVLHRPSMVSGVHGFRQLYGGRLVTDIFAEPEHVDFLGNVRKADCTRITEPEMRLHVDDADHHFRARLQLLAAVKNPRRVATEVAAVPPDELLRSEAGCDPATLRAPLFRHYPPKLFDEEVAAARPLLFGPADAPMVQADAKPLHAFAEAGQRQCRAPSFETEEARREWAAFHEYLARHRNGWSLRFDWTIRRSSTSTSRVRPASGRSSSRPETCLSWTTTVPCMAARRWSLMMTRARGVGSSACGSPPHPWRSPWRSADLPSSTHECLTAPARSRVARTCSTQCCRKANERRRVKHSWLSAAHMEKSLPQCRSALKHPGVLEGSSAHRSCQT